MRKLSKSVIGFFVGLLTVTCLLTIYQSMSEAKVSEDIKRESEKQKENMRLENSPLIDFVALSPHADFPRDGSVEKITIHHTAGVLSLEDMGRIFTDRDRDASANYGIDIDGNVGLFVEEKNRAYSSSNPDNDNKSITIEVSNNKEDAEWTVSQESYNALLDLCEDICRRYEIKQLNFTGDETGNLTMHCMYSNTTCPGPYLKGRMSDIANSVNRRLRKED